MPDKIAKALERLSVKERNQVKLILEHVKAGNLNMLDIKKLKGHTDIFRVRKGSLRIIYSTSGVEIRILAIERRSEKTYRDF